MKNPWMKLGLSFLALIVAVAALTAVIIVKFDTHTDSGIAACQTLADNATKAADQKKPVGLEDFQKSKHTDLKVAGVDFVTTVKSDGGENAIATLTKMHTQYSILQTACANHGVNLPALPS